jgi:crossover junction endodeoxyribonuclease RuvC
VKILAIDPGLSGAVVLLCPGTLLVRTDFKHIEDMTRAIDELSAAATVAVVELVAARPGQGVSSMFTFGMAAGVALGSLHSNGFSAFDKRRKKLIEVAPGKWQNFFWSLVAGDDEDSTDPLGIHPFNSVEFVMRFYPDAEQFLQRVKDHNTADAILMAIWYACTSPEVGSLRSKDKDRLHWLIRRYNVHSEKD